uniref:Cadherin domain-containing protein n=1 Tax=Seriola dumerili TaxID=41447 RepID=A0A3B4U9F9_SERDU
MNKQTVALNGDCFKHIEFYFKSNKDAHTHTHTHTRTKRYEEEMIQSGAHWAIVAATVRNITPHVPLKRLNSQRLCGTEGTGSASTSGVLDREERDEYALDEGGEGLTGFTDVIINVWDINDNAPVFTCAPSCHGDVAENSVVGTSVMEMTATDLDDSAVGQNAVLSYRIVGSLDATNIELEGVPTFSEMFTINPTTGTITVAMGGLDREQVESYLLVVEARDGGGMTGTGTVEDYNDHAPVFIPHFLSLAPLPEDITVGTSVARLVASDSDSGQNRDITYSLSEDSDPEGLFTIDQSGVLSVARPLDRERVPQHHLVVIATDHGLPPLTGSATVQLPLLDVNDNGPEFEVVRLNQTSTLLRAVDQDSPENGPPFHFTIPSEYRHSNDFYLQDNLNGTATLTALRMFDRERQKEFLIPIIMSDSGRPPKTVTSTLTVTIGDQNDHAHVAGEKKIFINSHRVLLLGIFLYTRWRSYKGLKEGVYHVSAHHDGWEDIRENVLNYDEEGGGEEDQPLDSLSRTASSTTLPPSVASTSSTATTTTSLRRDVPPTRLPAQGQARPSQLARRSLSFSSQDLARYLCEIIRDADQHPDTGPFDSLQVFSTEGGGSPAGSLSSFSSARREETLGEWGPRFEKLRALYERAEASDL